jgi:hypothetical protein
MAPRSDSPVSRARVRAARLMRFGIEDRLTRRSGLAKRRVSRESALRASLGWQKETQIRPAPPSRVVRLVFAPPGATDHRPARTLARGRDARSWQRHRSSSGRSAASSVLESGLKSSDGLLAATGLPVTTGDPAVDWSRDSLPNPIVVSNYGDRDGHRDSDTRDAPHSGALTTSGLLPEGDGHPEATNCCERRRPKRQCVKERIYPSGSSHVEESTAA